MIPNYNYNSDWLIKMNTKSIRCNQTIIQWHHTYKGYYLPKVPVSRKQIKYFWKNTTCKHVKFVQKLNRQTCHYACNKLKPSQTLELFRRNRHTHTIIGWSRGCMFTSSAGDHRRYLPRPGQTKDFEIGCLLLFK